MSDQRGDTIIEVLFAITVFSLVAVGGLSLMNQGAAMAQRSLEVGLVRQQIDAQSDALHYLNSAYIENFQQGAGNPAFDAWTKVVTAHKTTEAQDFDDVTTGGICRLPDETGSKANHHPFALDLTKLSDVLSPDPAVSQKALGGLVVSSTNSETYTYAKVDVSPSDASKVEGQGIWIEPVQDSSNKNFYDFHITACWTSPGLETPIKLGTIVRLYAPEK